MSSLSILKMLMISTFSSYGLVLGQEITCKALNECGKPVESCPNFGTNPKLLKVEENVARLTCFCGKFNQMESCVNDLKDCPAEEVQRAKALFPSIKGNCTANGYSLGPGSNGDGRSTTKSDTPASSPTGASPTKSDSPGSSPTGSAIKTTYLGALGAFIVAFAFY